VAQPKRVLFVCLGNIIRSPLAENLFLHLASQAGLADKYTVDSAGTGSWHVGEPPDPRMRSTAAEHGVPVNGSARQFRVSDFDRFDLIVAMDLQNRADLTAMARHDGDRAKIRLLREFDPQGGPQAAVPDPYYGGRAGFENTYQIVERSVRGLLEHLEQDHK
jgi:protein-tyrosine phosphatase